MVRRWECPHAVGEPTTIALVTGGDSATDCTVELRPLGYRRMTFVFSPEEALAIGRRLVLAGERAMGIEASVKALTQAMGAVAGGGADEL